MNDTYQPSPDDVEAFRAACDGCDMLTDGHLGLLTRAAKFFHARRWRDPAEVEAMQKERDLDREAFEQTLKEIDKDRAQIRADRDALAERCRSSSSARDGTMSHDCQECARLRAERDRLAAALREIDTHPPLSANAAQMVAHRALAADSAETRGREG